MAIYNYKCKECEHEFQEHLRMDDRKLPEESPCPECGKEDAVVLQIGAPKIVRDQGSILGKTSQGWKDLVKHIKKGSGKGNTIND